MALEHLARHRAAVYEKSRLMRALLACRDPRRSPSAMIEPAPDSAAGSVITCEGVRRLEEGLIS